MGSFINAVVVAVISAVSVGSTVGFVLEWQGDNVVRFEGMESEWGFTPEGAPLLRTNLTFYNEHRMAVTLTRLHLEATVNGAAAGSADLGRPVAAPAEQATVVPLTVVLPATFAGGWWDLHLAQGERTVLALEGEAAFRLAGRVEIVPYRWETETTTQVAEALGVPGRDCSPDARGPCIGPVDFVWQALGIGRPALEAHVAVSSARNAELVVRGASATLLWSGVPVARGGASGELEVPAGETGELRMGLPFDGERLQDWWRRHAAACEKTTMTMVLELEMEERRLVPGPVDDEQNATWTTQVTTFEISWTSPEAELRTGMVCEGETA